MMLTDRFRCYCRRCGAGYDARTSAAPARYCSKDCANEPVQSGRSGVALFSADTILVILGAGFLLGALVSCLLGNSGSRWLP